MPLSKKSLEVSVTNLETKEEIIYPSLRKAALSLNTTGQTIKAYLEEGKIFKDKYSIKYYYNT